MATYLEFERPLAELTAKIEELSQMGENADVNIAEEVARLNEKRDLLVQRIYGEATRYQISQLARHSDRPCMLYYIDAMTENFQELHGDRAFSDDQAIVGGVAHFHGRSVMVIGQQKGADTKEKIRRNFGMPRPEGYRKALRLMKLAEKMKMPVLTFIDTAGAWPGIDAEERGQSEAIARNLMELAVLKVPVLCTVIGEGGSGGALAIGVGDRLLMQQFTTYSVISPEGCAAILWRDRAYANDAVEALKPTAADMQKHGLLDRIVPEPNGGAHRSPKAAAEALSEVINEELSLLLSLSVDELLRQRQQRLRQFGVFKEA